MPASLIEGDSLLALDVGSVNTRSLLFEVVDGRYRFIASGQSPTTAFAPVRDIGVGVRESIEDLQRVTGRTFLDMDGQLIVPSSPEGNGADLLAGTVSAGPAVKTVVTGLLSDVSLKSARNLADTSYTRVVETIGLNDRRRPDELIDALIRTQPELILVAGGTDGGASRSVQKILEIIGLACYLLPEDKRPAVLYAGNKDLADEASALLGKFTSALQFSANIRPSLEVEDLSPAAHTLAQMLPDILKRYMNGIDELHLWTGGKLLPSAYAQSRMVRFLSQVYGSAKGILCVDLGASAASFASSISGQLALSVFPQFGMGENMAGLLRHTTVDEIARWLFLDIPLEAVRDYLYRKTLYPGSIPATKDELAIEQAAARQVLYLATQAAIPAFPKGLRAARRGMLPYFEPIIVSGGTLSRAPTLGQTLLMLLDGLQPTGITTIVLDQNDLLGALGAAADANPLIPVQVFVSGAFLNLATVISPAIHNARYGSSVLRVRLETDNGNESRMEVRFGAMEVISIPSGVEGRLTLQPLQRADIGFGPGRSGTVKVVGGTMGVVIDARGRPLDLPADPVRRRELLKKWLWTVGG